MIVKIPANTDKRINELPHEVFLAIRKDFMTLTAENSRPRQKWYNLIKGKVFTLKKNEYEVFKKHLGCSELDLMNPDVSLLAIYLAKSEKMAKVVQFHQSQKLRASA